MGRVPSMDGHILGNKVHKRHIPIWPLLHMLIQPPEYLCQYLVPIQIIE